MHTSEKIGAIAAALAKAQAEIKNPTKDKTANIPNKSGGPGFKYSYADFATALDEIRPVLSKHGIAFVQGTEWTGSLIMLNTRLIHESGEWMEGQYPVGGMADHRTMGSALSYARRYALLSLIGVQGEDDDDGEADQNARRDAPKPAPAANPSISERAAESIADTYIRKMNAATSLKSLEEEISKARAAYGRMTPAEKTRMMDVVEARRAFWMNAPQDSAA